MSCHWLFHYFIKALWLILCILLTDFYFHVLIKWLKWYQHQWAILKFLNAWISYQAHINLNYFIMNKHNWIRQQAGSLYKPSPKRESTLWISSGIHKFFMVARIFWITWFSKTTSTLLYKRFCIVTERDPPEFTFQVWIVPCLCKWDIYNFYFNKNSSVYLLITQCSF
jgi:hypothetical protein